jgi:lipoate-protein ligase B
VLFQTGEIKSGTYLLIDLNDLAQEIRKLHDRIRTSVVNTCENARLEELSEIEQDTAGDTIYGIDRISED